MSNILNIKNLDGDWDSIVAIRGKQGEPGADGTKFEVNARFVPGNNVVPIADFITDKGTDKEITHTIYAPKGEGGGATVEYTDLHTFTDTKTIGRIDIDGESTNIVIPAKVSEFDNDVEYVYRGITQRVHTPLVVEDGEVHNARTDIEGWASKILLVFNTDFNGDYIDIYKDEGESHPVKRMPLKYGDGTKASFKAGEFCEVALSDEFSDFHSDEFVVLSRSYSKLSEFENDGNFIGFASVKLMVDSAKTEMAARSGQLIAMEWDAETEYSAGDYVLYTQSVMGGAAYPALYKALSDNTNVLPTNRTVWKNTLVADELGSGGGSNISVGHAYKRGSYSVASNAYDDITLSVTLPEGAIPISVVPYVEGSYTEIWAKEQYTYENNVLTQKVWVHNKGSSTATCHPCINVWYLMGASYYDAGATQGEE